MVVKDCSLQRQTWILVSSEATFDARVAANVLISAVYFGKV